MQQFLLSMYPWVVYIANKLPVHDHEVQTLIQTCMRRHETNSNFRILSVSYLMNQVN